MNDQPLGILAKRPSIKLSAAAIRPIGLIRGRHCVRGSLRSRPSPSRLYFDPSISIESD